MRERQSLNSEGLRLDGRAMAAPVADCQRLTIEDDADPVVLEGYRDRWCRAASPEKTN
ncbi:hypothetical protein [Rhizobium aegyptiacum]|uniref:hypothetical protein n=1 Tax=Rhizobium aegyptiacum TaxID=1764550 RepID=UPI000AB69190|nr:hypothetical protein [Rhizobium aegyptiacum]